MTDAVMQARIANRRAEQDVLEEELVKRLAEVRDERDELVVAERVVQRISEQGFGEYLSLAPAPPGVQMGGRSVLLIPVRAVGAGPEVLPADYQQILMIVQQAADDVSAPPHRRLGRVAARAGRRVVPHIPQPEVRVGPDQARGLRSQPGRAHRVGLPAGTPRGARRPRADGPPGC
jgi:hypothetical protein